MPSVQGFSTKDPEKVKELVGKIETFKLKGDAVNRHKDFKLGAVKSVTMGKTKVPVKGFDKIEEKEETVKEETKDYELKVAPTADGRMALQRVKKVKTKETKVPVMSFTKGKKPIVPTKEPKKTLKKTKKKTVKKVKKKK